MLTDSIPTSAPIQEKSTKPLVLEMEIWMISSSILYCGKHRCVLMFDGVPISDTEETLPNLP